MANVKLKSSSKLMLPASRGAKQSAAQETGRPSPSRAAANTARHPPDMKNAKLLAMLRSPSGATVMAMMKETGWQQHSVRGFLAGVVRKRLKLNLVSEEAKGGRVYRVGNKRSTTGKAAVSKRSS